MFSAQLCFTPALSKQLIAKGVSALPEVRNAFEGGKIMLAAGVTTAHIFTELSGALPEDALACGMVSTKGTCVGQAMSTFLGKHGHANYWFFDRGKISESQDIDRVLEGFSSHDVFIKGANAIDCNGRAGVMLGVETGGFMGKAIGHVMAKGINFLIPAGLEKAVLGSIPDVARGMGTRKVDYSSGMPVGLIPIAGKVVTEVEAFKSLADVEVFHVASGGAMGAEGSVTLLVKGKKVEVEKCLDIYRDIRQDSRFSDIRIQPAQCKEHKWETCIKKNILYKENVINGV